MKIAFVTTQTPVGSTVTGRVFPLAKQLANNHEVHVLVHTGTKESRQPTPYHLLAVGKDPFVRTPHGKVRQKGIRLAWTMVHNTVRSVAALHRLNPDVMVIVKALPQNVLATWLYTRAVHPDRKHRIILDADDFELASQSLSSVTQRAAIHWAERTAVTLADHIVTASPFLADHYEQLARQTKPVSFIPTGLDFHSSGQQALASAPPRLVYVGSVSVSSGHRVDMLPDILEHIHRQEKQVPLHIIGSGDDITYLKRAFKEKHLSDSVTWHGRFRMSELAKLLHIGDILLDPVDSSIANRAKSSFRAALAAAAGLPIVTSDVGVRPYHLPGSLHRRLFATPADAASYAQKITDLLRAPLTRQERELMQTHGTRYTWDKLARQFEQLIS